MKEYVIPASQVVTGYRRTKTTQSIQIITETGQEIPNGSASTVYSSNLKSDSNRIAYEYAVSDTTTYSTSTFRIVRREINYDFYRIDLYFNVSGVPVDRIQSVKLRAKLISKNTLTPRGYYISTVGGSSGIDGSHKHFDPQSRLAICNLGNPSTPYIHDTTLSSLSSNGWYCLWNQLNADFNNREILNFDLSNFYLVITTDETVVNTYTVSYDKGTYGTGDNATATKTEDVVLTLSGAIFTRSDYTQTGWSINADGSTKDYDLEGNYTANADITLYPYWTHGNVNPNNVLFIMTENGLQAIL